MAIAKYEYDVPSTFRFFEDTLSRLLNEPASTRPWSPAVDIYETEDALVLKADVPDVELKDIDINLENGTLTLKGERRFEKTERNKGFHRLERSFGSFMRAFAVPETVDTEHVKAEYAKGVLTVTLPKKEVAKPRSIRVEVSGE
jgi:HSP20 family protein